MSRPWHVHSWSRVCAEECARRQSRRMQTARISTAVCASAGVTRPTLPLPASLLREAEPASATEAGRRDTSFASTGEMSAADASVCCSFVTLHRLYSACRRLPVSRCAGRGDSTLQIIASDSTRVQVVCVHVVRLVLATP